MFLVQVVHRYNNFFTIGVACGVDQSTLYPRLRALACSFRMYLDSSRSIRTAQINTTTANNITDKMPIAMSLSLLVYWKVLTKSKKLETKLSGAVLTSSGPTL